MKIEYSKRDILIGTGSLGVACLAASSSQSQEAAVLQVDLSPEQIGNFHQSRVAEARGTVIDENPFSVESFQAALKRLVEQEIIDGKDSNNLLQMIKIVLGGKTLDDIYDEINDYYNKTIDTLRDLAATIAIIIHDSVELALEFLRSETVEKVIDAIAHDIRGAIDGAIDGATLSPLVPRVGKLGGAIIGALMGATSASIIGYYKK